MGQSGDSPQGITGSSSVAPAYRDTLGFNSRWGHDRRVSGAKSLPETRLSRARAVRASAISLALTALLAAVFASGCGVFGDHASEMRACASLCGPSGGATFRVGGNYGPVCVCAARADGGAR